MSRTLRLLSALTCMPSFKGKKKTANKSPQTKNHWVPALFHGWIRAKKGLTGTILRSSEISLAEDCVMSTVYTNKKEMSSIHQV